MKWLAAWLSLILCPWLAVLLIYAAPTLAMGWYPSTCCSNRDCEEIGADFIGETKAGWNINFCSATRPNLCIKGFFPRGKEQPSMDGDGEYHICFNASRIICFFVPQNT